MPPVFDHCIGYIDHYIDKVPGTRQGWIRCMCKSMLNYFVWSSFICLVNVWNLPSVHLGIGWNRRNNKRKNEREREWVKKMKDK